LTGSTRFEVNLTIDQHVKGRQIELAQRIRNVKKIYLDTRFWIIARDVSQGTDSRPAAIDLTRLLRGGVAAGHIVCPISESTFAEVLKQAPTPSRRLASAALIDELSGGVSITTSRSRVGTEIAHFFYRNSGQKNLHDLQDLVWTRLSYAMGYLHPALDTLDAAAALQIQRDVFDTIWSRPLVEVMPTIGADAMQQEVKNLTELARRQDAQIKAHEVDLVSFEQTYRDEVRGALDAAESSIAEVLGGMAERAGFESVPPGSAEQREFAIVARNLLAVAFEKGLAQDTLRTIHAQASLHAGLRWNKRTTFDANHFYDFEHAAAAVAYCDAFFTEGFLSNLINARHIRLDTVNNCRTTNDLDRAIEILRGVGCGPNSE